jgi:hypothetical protein
LNATRWSSNACGHHQQQQQQQQAMQLRHLQYRCSQTSMQQSLAQHQEQLMLRQTWKQQELQVRSRVVALHPLLQQACFVLAVAALQLHLLLHNLQLRASAQRYTCGRTSQMASA